MMARSRQLSPLTLFCGDALQVARELPSGSVDCRSTARPQVYRHRRVPGVPRLVAADPLECSNPRLRLGEVS